MLTSLSNQFKKRFNLWLSKRLKVNNHQILTNRNTYIFPTGFGFCYLAFVFLLFLLGTNYQNNLILLTCFILVSFFISAILHTFVNLAGIELRAENRYPIFLGQENMIKLNVNTKKSAYAVDFNFLDDESNQLTLSKGTVVIHLPYLAENRGIENIKRLTVASRFAFGLFNCWSHVQFASQVIVYPKPIEINQAQFDHLIDIARLNGSEDNGENSKAKANIHGDDFSELRRYQVGESLSQVAWKNVAKGQPWMTKQYESSYSEKIIFNLADIPGSDIEVKLGILCYLFLMLQQSQIEYGINISNINVLPASNVKHHERCLTLLAEHQS